MISTRGRYALRVLIDLAGRDPQKLTPMKEIAADQELSVKYMEQIVPVLSKNGLVEGHHGKGGGYRLSRTPQEYTVGEILRLTEGDLAPVACLGCNAQPCTRAAQCPTLPMWTRFYDMVNDFFDHITLAQLLP